MAATMQGTSAPLTHDHVRVIGASSLGTVFEWYDFWYPVVAAIGTFIVGSLFLRETKDVDITR